MLGDGWEVSCEQGPGVAEVQERLDEGVGHEGVVGAGVGR